MVFRTDLPDEWKNALIAAGMTTSAGEPSLRMLAQEVGVHPATISRMIKGANAGRPNSKLIKAVSRALDVPEKDVTEWTGHEWLNPTGEYIPPEGSAVLDHRQRETVNRIIQAFIDINLRERTGPRPRRSLDSKMVAKLAEKTGYTRPEMADLLEAIENGEI